ncbi:MAG: Metal-responsive transcriptional regulator [Candidatus Alkanophagales archaeon MCA70_species_1]|nr:Metal-responsive transcriptional regulator [Candidatus Alkanophaga volatiphilum]
MPVVSFSVSEKLVRRFNEILSERGYASRSEAFREAMRNYISEYEWTKGVGERAIAVITVLYDKKMRKDLLSNLQHEYDDVIPTMMHLHLDETNCFEVFVTKGDSKRILELIRKIKSIRGVKQVKFIATSSEL